MSYLGLINPVIAPGNGTVTPATISQGGPSWDTSGNLTSTGVSKLGSGTTQASPNSTDITSGAHTLLSGVGGNYLAFGQYGSGNNYAQWIQSAYQNPTTATYNLILNPLGGGVSIGTSNTGGRKLRVAGEFTITEGSSNLYELYFLQNSSYARIGPTYQAGGSYVPLTFWTSDAERVRVDTSGGFTVGPGVSGGVSGTNVAAFAPDGSLSPVLQFNSNYGGGAKSMLIFKRNGTTTGSISENGTSTSYNTSSDYRLKENISPMIGALSVVSQLKPVTYTWKADGSDGQGFIAHELQSVVPDCVTGEKDAVDAEGNPVYQGIDTSFLVATLTAAIQEQQAQINDQQAIIESLKTRIETLEAK